MIPFEISRVTLFGGFSRGSGRIAARPGETPFLDSSSLDAPSRVSSVFSELVEAVVPSRAPDERD